MEKPDLTLFCTRYYTQTCGNGEGMLCLNRLHLKCAIREMDIEERMCSKYYIK